MLICDHCTSPIDDKEVMFRHNDKVWRLHKECFQPWMETVFLPTYEARRGEPTCYHTLKGNRLKEN